MKNHKRQRATKRDQDPTVFTEILENLLDLSPSAAASALVDGEGETVDYAGDLPTFYVKVAAAHFRIVFGEIDAALFASHGRSQQIVIRGRARTFVVRALSDGYALVVLLKRGAFTISSRAMAVSERDLSREAGWSVSALGSSFWHPAVVEAILGDRRRPGRMRVGSRWQTVQVLGALVGLRHERGYRCRLHSGAEVTLVREAGGAWYADDLIEDVEDVPRLVSSRPPLA